VFSGCCSLSRFILLVALLLGLWVFSVLCYRSFLAPRSYTQLVSRSSLTLILRYRSCSHGMYLHLALVLRFCLLVSAFAAVGYACRVVELVGTLLDQTVVLYGAFIAGLSVAVCYVGWFWCRRIGAVHSWAYHSVLEMLWTVVPVLFLALGLVQGMATLYAVCGAGELAGFRGSVASVVGHQWYWELDGLDSRMVGSAALGSLGVPRLALVDQPLFVSCGTSVCLGVSSADVIHCYSVPGLGVKVDAIPGRVSWVCLAPLLPGYFSG